MHRRTVMWGFLKPWFKNQSAKSTLMRLLEILINLALDFHTVSQS